jgi:hypothetical protein
MDLTNDFLLSPYIYMTTPLIMTRLKKEKKVKKDKAKKDKKKKNK